MKVYFIFTVGKTIEPIRFSIKKLLEQTQANRLKAYALASKDSEPIINNIIKEYGIIPEKYIVEDYEDWNECLKASYNLISRVIKEWEKERGEIIVDYTGGTKSMSSALVYASQHVLPSFKLRYVGGKERDKDGRVISGYEKIRELESFVYVKLLDVKKYYEAYNLEHAAIILEDISEETKSSYYETLANFVKALVYRDRFNYRQASQILNRYKRKMNIFADKMVFPVEVANFFEKAVMTINYVDQIKETVEFLSKLKNAKNGVEAKKIVDEFNQEEKLTKGFELLIIDFILNIERRIKRKQSLEACIAAYRTYELITQYSLIVNHKISPKLTNWDDLSDDVISYFKEKRKDLPENLDLNNSIILLKYLGDSVVKNLEDKILKNLQFERNNSLLEHGFSTVKIEVVERALQNINVTMAELFKNFHQRKNQLKFPKLTDDVLLIKR
ncbi:MAG TPA: TIGR02710 family CRISPR-associated protein [Candidatus Desulfofervidus auxilii]|uniref:TIGR02710 family CRISPR-associated protein n=1 Tax=Desulfofervidus auxilii TaxID=1621989 RepID=A0A7V0NEJ9_DESA2|nr:TIGR02710 family CRISPR-associated protein [Candidatus Desulfofervidus auxilii]